MTDSALAQFVRRSVSDAAQFLYVERGLFPPSWFAEQSGHLISHLAKQVKILEGDRQIVADEAEWLHQAGMRQAFLRDANSSTLLEAFNEYRQIG